MLGIYLNLCYILLGSQGGVKKIPRKRTGPGETQEDIMVKHLTAFYLTALAALIATYPIISLLKTL